MDSSYPGNLRLWDAAAATLSDRPISDQPHPLPGPHHPSEFAERLYVREALGPPVRKDQVEAAAEPYTLQWFLNIETRRHSRHGRWIPRLLEFAKHNNESLLGLGSGLGTDWVQYARHGADVVVCTPSADQLALIRRNFELRGLKGRFLHCAPTALPLDAASIDVACLSGLLDELEDPAAAVQDVYRVLKPGGKVLAVTSAKYDVDFWRRLCLPWERARGPASPGRTPPRYSARRLRRLFGAFVEHRVYKRQLRRSELPHLWRLLPLGPLERIMGHCLVLKAFKPLSAAIPLQAAA
jgi:SAM-dependent methyltransferase